MALSAGDMDLVQQLEEVGLQLPHCPTDATELLPLLNRVDVLLSQVDQSPSQELLDACSVVMKLVVDDRFLGHSDTDVKVHIASCVCELTRITAPEAPYDDEKMKETFQLIVSSFRGLSDMADGSYAKRTSILDNVARIKSSLVMLDLELDSLVVEMFGHFLDSIRDYHPPPIFSHMESIMTLVIEESEDVSLELLMPILDALKKNDDDPTISRKLGEKVLENCAEKVKPYLLKAVKSLGGAVSQYGAIVTGLCEESSVLEHGDDNSSMNQLDKASVETPVNEPVLVVPVNEPSALLDVNVNKDSRVEVGAETSIQEKKDKESQITLASSDNEKEVSRVSSPKQIENDVTDVSEFPVSHPDRSLCSKENLTEATPSVQPLDIEASDTNHDLDGKQQENCDEKNNNSIQKEEHIKDKKVKEDALTGSLASTDAPKRSVGSDVKTQKRSKKKMINSASKTPCDLESSKGADRAFNVSITRQKRSKRRPVNIAQEGQQLEEMAQGDVQQEEMAQGDMQQEEMAQDDPNQEKLGQDVTTEKCSGKRTTTDIPIDENLEETTSDSETKPLIMASKEIAKKLSSKKGKKNSNQPKAETVRKEEMTLNQPKAEIMRKEKGKDQTGGSEKGDGLGDTKAAVKEGEKESVASEPEEKLIEYVKKGKRGNDAHAEKEENIQGTESSKGKKRSGDSDADAVLLTESAKKRQKTDLKKKPIKQSAKKGDIKTFLGRIGTSADDPKQETNSSKGKKRNLESESNSEIKKSVKAKKGTGTSEPEVESQKEAGEKEMENAPSQQLPELMKQDSGKKHSNKARGKSISINAAISKEKKTDIDVKDDNKEMISSPKTAKSASKSVRDEQSEGSNIKSTIKQGKKKVDTEDGANLINSRIKVWWKDDKQFYEGVVASFDRKNKKHKVLYDDGEIEMLNLKKETWEFVEGEPGQKDVDKDAAAAEAEASQGKQKSASKSKSKAGKPRKA